MRCRWLHSHDSRLVQLAAYLIILSTIQGVVTTAMVIIVTTCFDWYCIGQAWLKLAQPLMFLISSQDFHNCLGCLSYTYATAIFAWSKYHSLTCS